jgi:sucrose phosphorylase
MEGVRQTGRNRTINRQKLDEPVLAAELAHPEHLRRAVYDRMVSLLRARARTPAFHPLGRQRVLDVGAGVFALLRTSPEGEARALCLHDVGGEARSLRLDLKALDWNAAGAADVIDGRALPGDNSRRFDVRLGEYGVAWLVPAQ